MIDRSALLARLREQVARDLADLARRQQEAAAGATHEESRAEHAKDTRATEQSYLARGLAERVRTLEQDLRVLTGLSPIERGKGEPIAVTALVRIREEGGQLEEDEPTVLWWILPVAGGRTLEQDDVIVRTITPAAPLGRALVGLVEGELGCLRSPRGDREFEVLGVDQAT